MFENLSERLDRSFKLLKGEGKITEINVAETLKDVRKALLDADVNYKVAKSFTDTVKKLDVIRIVFQIHCFPAAFFELRFKCQNRTLEKKEIVKNDSRKITYHYIRMKH